MGIIEFGNIDPCLIRQGPNTMGGQALSYFLWIERRVKKAQERPSGITLPNFDLTGHESSFFSTRLLTARSYSTRYRLCTILQISHGSTAPPRHESGCSVGA